MHELSLPALSLYVHIPWCIRKCPYCDFNSHRLTADVPEAAYLQALIQDLDHEQIALQGRRLESIFFGGGTPSLLSGDFYSRFLEHLKDRVPLAPDTEITLEANPGSADAEKFAAYRQAGINRLSIGVQSFNDDHLKALGRIHDGQQAVMAVQAARHAGFSNINLDIMHGLPGQNTSQALDDLQRALDLSPTHLSWYELTIEPNTAFWSRPPRLPDNDAVADAEDAGFALLARAGFERYEISAFAQAGHRCRHNLNYWQFGDYLGIGAGAHGKITHPESNEILRYHKTRLPADYLAAKGQRRRDLRALDATTRVTEFLLNALRLTDGVDAALMHERTGVRAGALKHWPSLIEQGLMTPGRLCCTPTALAHLNTVMVMLTEDHHNYTQYES